MTTFHENRASALDLLAELVEYTATDYLDAHFPLEWTHQQIADAILKRHVEEVLNMEDIRQQPQ